MGFQETAAAIVAGGRARRFGGRDKSRLVVNGRTIIVRQIDVLQQVAHEVFVIANTPARFADVGLPVHPDRTPGLGALGGIDAALAVARSEYVVVVACDLPFLEAGLLSGLVALAEHADAAWVRGLSGVEPLIACYRRRAASAISAQIAAGRLKVADLGDVLHIAEMDLAGVSRFGDPARLLANINSPDDYARVQ